MAIEIVSTDDLGDEGNNTSTNQPGKSVISDDGRYVVFESTANDLVADDNNGTSDIFVHDRDTDTTTRVSVATGGAEAHGFSRNASISADGRYVVFQSFADDLVAGDTNGQSDIFLHDRDTGTTTRVSVATGGGQTTSTSLNASVSGDGRYVAFQSFASNLVGDDTNGFYDIFLHDTQTGTTTLISRPDSEEANGDSTKASISSDGRYITYQSDASNLVDGDTNFNTDIFIYDTQTETTTRIDPGQGLHGGALNAVETPGGLVWSYVIKTTESHRLGSDILYVDPNDVATIISSLSVAQYTATNDELLILIDDNNEDPILKFYVPSVTEGVGYLSELDPNTEEVLSLRTLHLSITDAQITHAISADGRYVVFSSDADGLAGNDSDGRYDVFLRDTLLATTTLVSAGTPNDSTSHNLNPSVSSDGRFVVFENTVNPFARGDIYVRDTVLGTTALVAPGFHTWISSDGQSVSFVSDANDLVPNDGNNTSDVFVSDNPLWALRDAPTIRSNGAGTSAEVTVAENTIAITTVAAVDSNTNQTLTYSIVGGDDSAKFVINASTGKLSFAEAPDFEVQTDVGSDNVYDVIVQVSDGADGLDTQDISVTVGDVNETSFAIRRASISSTAGESNQGSENHSSGQHNMSADGRFVVFWSLADNLVGGDTNGAGDIFLRDTWTGKSTLVSTGAAGQGNDHSFAATISANGRFVVFQSDADNLVAGDSNGSTDIFLRDTQTGTTTRLSTDSTETQGNDSSLKPSISDDARYIVFQSCADNLVADDTNGVSDVFLRDTLLGTTTLISTGDSEEANGRSFNASISADGRYITYESAADNLVDGDANGLSDIFVYDRQTDTTTLIESGAPVFTGGTLSGEETPGGPVVWSYVIKTTDSLRIGSDILYDPGTGYTIISSLNVAQYKVTSDELYMLNDDNSEYPILEFRTLIMDPGIGLLSEIDPATGETISVRTLYFSFALSPANEAAQPSISADGRYVVFESRNSGLVAGDTNGDFDIFLCDTVTDTTTRISVDSEGDEVSGASLAPSISADGRFIVFQSEADNLVANDTNDAADVFVRDLQTGSIVLVSTGASGQGDAASFSPTISADGRTISFLSDATNLVDGDTNDSRDLFVADNPLFVSKLTKGSQHADVIVLFGNTDHTVLARGGNDLVRGLGGNDDIHGGRGNDVLIGGSGQDNLFGDAGQDIFKFRSAVQSSVDNPDFVADFRHGKDKIDLSDINPAGPANKFHFIGSDGFSGDAGELRFDAASKLIQGDVDGDGRADFAILVDVANLTKHDFLL
jgi:Tol biopolymer transport system component